MSRASDKIIAGVPAEEVKYLPQEKQKLWHELQNPEPVLPSEPYSPPEGELSADFEKVGIEPYYGDSVLTQEVDSPVDPTDKVRFQDDRAVIPVETYTASDVVRDIESQDAERQRATIEGPQLEEERLRTRLLAATQQRFDAWEKQLTDRDIVPSFVNRRYYEEYFDQIRQQRETASQESDSDFDEFIKDQSRIGSRIGQLPSKKLQTASPDAPALTPRFALGGAALGGTAGALVAGPVGAAAGSSLGGAAGVLVGGAADLLKGYGPVGEWINNSYWGAVEQSSDYDRSQRIYGLDTTVQSAGSVADAFADSAFNIYSFLGGMGDMAVDAAQEEIGNITSGDEETRQWWGDMLLRRGWMKPVGEYALAALNFEQEQDVLAAPEEPPPYDPVRAHDGMIEYLIAREEGLAMGMEVPDDTASFEERSEFADRVNQKFNAILKNNMSTEERNSAANTANDVKLASELIGVAIALRVSYGNNRPDFDTQDFLGTDWDVNWGNSDQEKYEEAYDALGNRVKIKLTTPRHVVRKGEFYLGPVDAMFDIGVPVAGLMRRGTEAVVRGAANKYRKFPVDRSRKAVDFETGETVNAGDIDATDVYTYPVVDDTIASAQIAESELLKELDGITLDLPTENLDVLPVGALPKYSVEGTRLGDNTRTRFRPNAQARAITFVQNSRKTMAELQKRLDFSENITAKLQHSIEQYGRKNPDNLEPTALSRKVDNLNKASRIFEKQQLQGQLRDEIDALNARIRGKLLGRSLRPTAQAALLNITISAGASILWSDLEAEQLAAEENGDIFEVPMLRYVAIGAAPLLGGFLGGRGGLSLAQQRNKLAASPSRPLRDMFLGPSQGFTKGVSPDLRSAGDRILDGGERIDALAAEELRRRFAHDPEFMDLILPYSGARGDVAPPRTPDLRGDKSVRFAVRRVVGPKITVDETPTSTTTRQTGGTTLNTTGARGAGSRVSRPAKSSRLQYLSGSEKATNLRRFNEEVSFHGFRPEEMDDFGALVLDQNGMPLRYVSFTDKAFDASLLPEDLATAGADKLPVGWNPNRSLGGGETPFAVERITPSSAAQQTAARVANSASRKMGTGQTILVETPAGAAVQIPYTENLVLDTFFAPLQKGDIPVEVKLELVDNSPANAGANAGKNPRTADPVSETIQQADETRAPDSAPGVNKPQSEAAIEEVAAEEAATKPPRSKKTASKKTASKKKADDPEAFILDENRKKTKGTATRGRATRSDGVYHQYDNKRQGWGYYSSDGTEIDFIKGKKPEADAKFNKKYPVAADAAPPAAAPAPPAAAAADEAFDADPKALAVALDLTPEDVATRSDDFWRAVDPKDLGANVSGDEAAIEALVTQVLEGRSAALVRQAEENAATLAGLTEELAEQAAKTPAEIKADVKAAAKAAKAKAAAEKKAAADAEKAEDAAEQGAAPDPAPETPAPKIEPRTDAGTFVKVGGKRTTGARFRQDIEDGLLQKNPRISGVLLTEAATKRLEGLKPVARKNAVAKMGPTDVQYIVQQASLGSTTFQIIGRNGDVVELTGTRANVLRQFRTGKGRVQVDADRARKRADISVPKPETLAQKQTAAAAEGAEAVLPQDAPYQLNRTEARARAVNYGLDPDNVVVYRVRVGDSPVEENLYVFTGEQSVPKSQSIVINRGETDRVATYLDEADPEGIQKVLDEQGVNLEEIAQKTLSQAQVTRQTRIKKTRREQEVLVPTMYEIVQGRKQDGNQGKVVIHVRTAISFDDDVKPRYPKTSVKGDNKTAAKTITVKDGDWTKAFEQARDWVRRDAKKYPDATIDAPTKKDTGLGLPAWVRETLPIPQVADDFPFKTTPSNKESNRTLTKAFIRKNTLNLGPRVRGMGGNQFETRLEAAGYTIVSRSETGPSAKNPASWREANVAPPPTVQPTVRITDKNGETARALANLQNSVVHAVSEVETPVYAISIDTPTSVDRAGAVRAMTVSSDADPAFKSSSAIISEDTVAATVKTYENFQILLGEFLSPGTTPKPLSKLLDEFFDNEVSAGLIRRFDRKQLRENFEMHLEEFKRGRDASVSLERIYTKYVADRKRVTSNLDVEDSNLYDTLVRAAPEQRPQGGAQPLHGSFHSDLRHDQILSEVPDRSKLMPEGRSLVNRPQGQTVPGLEDWLPTDVLSSYPPGKFTGAGDVAASGPRGRPQDPMNVRLAQQSQNEGKRVTARQPDQASPPTVRFPRTGQQEAPEVPYGQRISQEGRPRTAGIEQKAISDINRIIGSQRPVAVHAGTHAPAWPFGPSPRLAARTGAKGPESEYVRQIRPEPDQPRTMTPASAEKAAEAAEGQAPVTKQFGETGPVRSGVREWVQNQLGKPGSIVVTKFDLSEQANNAKTKNTLVLRSKENVNTVEVFSDLKDGEVIKAADIGSKTSGKRSSLETNLRGKTSGKPVSAKGITEKEAAGAGGNGLGRWARRRPETAKQYWRGYADSMADDAMPRDPTLGRDLQGFGQSRGRIGGDDMLGGPRRVQRAKPVDGRPRATGPEPEWPNKDRVTEALDDSSGDAAVEVAEALETLVQPDPQTRLLMMDALKRKPAGVAVRLFAAAANVLTMPLKVLRSPVSAAERLLSDGQRAFSFVSDLRRTSDRYLNVTHGDLTNPDRNQSLKLMAYAVNRELGRVHREAERVGNQRLSDMADGVALYRNTLNDIENFFNEMTIARGNEWGLRTISAREGDVSPRKLDVASHDITGEEALEMIRVAKEKMLDPAVRELDDWARRRAQNPDDVLTLDRYADSYVPRLVDPVESIIEQYLMYYRGDMAEKFFQQRFHNSLDDDIKKNIREIIEADLKKAKPALRKYLNTNKVQQNLQKSTVREHLQADLDQIREDLSALAQSTGGKRSKFPVRSRQEPRESPDVGTMRDPVTNRKYEREQKDSVFGSDPAPGASAMGDFDRIRFMYDHQGFRLTTYNPIELIRLKAEELNNYLIGVRLLDVAQREGLVHPVWDDGIVKIEGPSGTADVTQLMEAVSEFSQVSTKGRKTKTLKYYADPDTALILSRNFSQTGLFKRGFAGSSALEDSPGSVTGMDAGVQSVLTPIRQTSNLLNMMQLGISMFHASTMMYEGASSHGALAVMKTSHLTRGVTRRARNLGSSADVKRADNISVYGGYYTELERKYRNANKIPDGKKLTKKQVQVIAKQASRELVKETAKHALMFTVPFSALARGTAQMPESFRIPFAGGTGRIGTGTKFFKAVGLPQGIPRTIKASPNNRLVYGKRRGPQGQTVRTARSLRGAVNPVMTTLPGFMDHIVGSIPGAKKLGIGYENKFGERLSYSTPFHGEAYGWANYGPTGAISDRLFRGILPSEQFDPTYAALVEKVAAVNGRAAGYRPEFRKLWDNTWRNQWENIQKEYPNSPYSQKFDRFSGADTQQSGLGKAAARTGKVVKTAAGVMVEGVEDASRLLFEKIVPNAKLAAYMDLARYEMMRLGDNANPLKVEDALNRAWDSVDNRFGQMVYDRLHWDRKMRDGMMLIQRAPGWNFGTAREFGGGLLDFGRQSSKTLKSVGADGEITPRMAYIIAQSTVIPLYGSYIEYFLTGEISGWDDEIGRDADMHPYVQEISNYVYNYMAMAHPLTGRTVNGVRERLSQPTNQKDIMKILAAFMKMLTGEGYGAVTAELAHVAASKTHPMISLGKDLITNRRHDGSEISLPDDTTTQSLGHKAGYAFETALPFSFTTLAERMAQGLPPKQLLAQLLGLTRANRQFEIPRAAQATRDLRKGDSTITVRTSEVRKLNKTLDDWNAQQSDPDAIYGPARISEKEATDAREQLYAQYVSDSKGKLQRGVRENYQSLTRVAEALLKTTFQNTGEVLTAIRKMTPTDWKKLDDSTFRKIKKRLKNTADRTERAAEAKSPAAFINAQKQRKNMNDILASGATLRTRGTREAGTQAFKANVASGR